MLYRSKICTVPNGMPIFISGHFDFGQNLKKKNKNKNKTKHFPNGIFQWNLAQSRRTWINLHY